MNRHLVSLISRARSVKAVPCQNRGITTSTTCLFWNKDWKPGPYPKTQQQRLSAAKKYGLQPEDYEPYPEEEGYGDYPNITPISVDSRDPFEHWDDEKAKRNFGEPIEINSDYYDAFRLDITKYDPNNPDRFPPITHNRMVLQWVVLWIVILSLNAFFEQYPHQMPVMPKQFPYNDLWVERGEDPKKMPILKHYTFEPAN